MDAFKGFLTSRKRKIEEEEEELDRYFSKKRNCDEEEDTSDVIISSFGSDGNTGHKERTQTTWSETATSLCAVTYFSPLCF